MRQSFAAMVLNQGLPMMSVIVEEENPAVTPGYVIRTSHDDGSLDRDKKEVLTVYVSKEVIVSSEVTSSEDDFFGFEW